MDIIYSALLSNSIDFDFSWMSSIIGTGGIVALMVAVFAFLRANRRIDTDVYNKLIDRYDRRIEILEQNHIKCEEQHVKCEEQNHKLQLEIISLRKAMIRMEANIESPMAGVVVVDDNGVIIDWSPSASALFYYNKDEVIGNNVSMIIPHRLRPKHSAAFKKIVQEKRVPTSNPVDTSVLTRNGNEILVRILLSGWEVDGKWFYSAEIRYR